MKRRGRRVVELAKRPGSRESLEVDSSACFLELLELPHCFPLECPEKRIDVVQGRPAFHVRRSGSQIVRYRDRGRGRHDALAGMLSEPLQQGVATERAPERDDSRVGMAPPEQIENQIGIGRLPRMIETHGAIRDHPIEIRLVAGTRSEIDRRRGRSDSGDPMQQTLHVDGVRASLQTVKQDESRIGVSLEMVENELVSIGGRDRLSNRPNESPRSGQSSPDRLGMSVRDQARGCESILHRSPR